MERKDWDRIGSLFEEALKRSGAEREAFLSSLRDEDLEQELRSLLAAHEGRGGFDRLADYVSGPQVRRLLRLAPGDKIGPYRIVRELGSGGMATVYEAEDLKHERQVAIKVLRPELAAVLGADRFLHEISTTAKLQHPHILPLLDSGQAEGLLYYVMPCIEGETLRGRLNRETQLGIEEAVRIASEVADALDYAHRHEVIHRDIKPENILLHDGRPLVADFGIAVALSAAGGERITETGLSLGTPQYMSPEQATAEKDLTHRSDIYSLGCVLYEMLTGEPPHMGTSAQQIMRKVVTDEVTPITELRKSVPPNVAAAAAKSLEKLPADRFESARTFAEALADPTFVQARGPRRRQRWSPLTAGLAAVAGIAALAAAWGWLRPGARYAAQPVTEFTLAPPDSAMSFGVKLALSPDGGILVAEVDDEGGHVLYQRRLDSRVWQRIPGTEGGTDPFFSPNGAWLGFLSRSEGAIKKLPVDGGPVQTVAKVPNLEFRDWGVGATWGRDGTIVFNPLTTRSEDERPGLFQVSAEGGLPERLTTVNRARRELGHYNPHFTPGGDVILFTAVYEPYKPYVAALSLASRTVVRLAPGSTPQSNPAGRVVYVTPGGSVVAQALNVRDLCLEGSPSPIADRVLRHGTTAAYSISASGSIAFRTGSDRSSRLILVDREGSVRPLFTIEGGFTLALPRFSPSGNRIAFVRKLLSEPSRADIWVYSLTDGTARRLSFEGLSTDPAWTTDGRSIAYSVYREGDGLFTTLYLRSADGTGEAKQILEGDDHLWQPDFAPGNREVLFFKAWGVFRASLSGDSRQVRLIETEAMVTDPALSPDGRWLAYTSNESGISEVYVRSYPDIGPATVVSVGGGNFPVWSADGKELFYWGRAHLMAASIQAEGSRVRLAGTTKLFPTGSFQDELTRNYDVHPNGREFVMVGGVEDQVIWRVNALAGER